MSFSLVIPAKAGCFSRPMWLCTQPFKPGQGLDPGFRRDDGIGVFR